MRCLRVLTCFLVLSLFTSPFIKSQILSEGYYITLNDDTVQTKILYSDIFESQKELRTSSSKGEKIIHPNEIKEFGIKKDTSLKLLNFYKTVITDQILNEDFLPKRSGFIYDQIPLVPWIKPSKNLLFDSLTIEPEYIRFRSVDIYDGVKFFLVSSCGRKEYLQVYKYYYYVESKELTIFHKPLPMLNCELLLFKNNKHILLPLTYNPVKRLSILVSDYALLSTLLNEKTFPFNVELVVNTYNTWRIQKSINTNSTDTLEIIRKVIEVKNYK